MFRKSYSAVAVAATVTALSLASCGGSKDKAVTDTPADTVVAEEAPAGETVAYGAEFFANPDNEASKVASDSLPSYTTTPSGLKYTVVTPGTGASPAATDRVEVHYTGRLLDGTVFDSSVQRGEPITFPLQGVIKGWTEGLQLMKEGGTTVFYIPSDLAYGEQGTPGGPIPPNAPLIFEVQLLKVNP